MFILKFFVDFRWPLEKLFGTFFLIWTLQLNSRQEEISFCLNKIEVFEKMRLSVLLNSEIFFLLKYL